jgi:hypothetical protein
MANRRERKRKVRFDEPEDDDEVHKIFLLDIYCGF